MNMYVRLRDVVFLPTIYYLKAQDLTTKEADYLIIDFKISLLLSYQVHVFRDKPDTYTHKNIVENLREIICKHRIWLQKNLTIWSLKICILQYIDWIQNCCAYIFVRKLQPWVVLTVISHWTKFRYFYFVVSPPVLLYPYWST